MTTFTKGRIEQTHKQEITSDIQKVLDMLNKGFYLTENNTSLEHKEGGYLKLSKRVTNYFNN